MTINSLFQIFTPKDRVFFPLFEQAATELVLLAETLKEAVSDSVESRAAYYTKVDASEAALEEIVHLIQLELSQNFITPFDREDIHLLIKAIDSVADNIHSAASKLRIYHVVEITPPIQKLTAINLEACRLISEAVAELKNLKNLKLVIEICKKISKLESKADVVFDTAIAELFEKETDIKSIIKYKEVLSSLEDASDRCKTVAAVLEQIVVKHS